MIAGSGYSDQANFENATDILVNEQKGTTSLPPYLQKWTGQSLSTVSFNSLDMKSNLQAGCVAVIHTDYSSNPLGHWMAVLDYDADKDQVYISNPWHNGGSPAGWSSIDVFGYNPETKKDHADKVFYITNDGSSVDYGAGGSSSGSSSTSSVNMSGNITKITDWWRSGYKINVDWDKEVDSMLETLKKKNYKLEKYLDKSLQKEYLKNMLKAAIVTQYPDLRSAEEITKDRGEIPANETQGCIKIKRAIDSETQSFAGDSLSNPVDPKDNCMYLTYMPYSEFSKLIASADKSAFNYFSMDSSNNLVVAGWETLDVSVSIEQIEGEPDPNPDSAPEPRAKEYAKLVEKKINYVNQVSNYTMPFSLLWSLLVYGNDEEFVNDVAKLVIDTDIVIGCYDVTNKKVTTYTNTYDKHNITEDNVYVNNKSTGETVLVDHVYTYQVIEKQVLKTDVPSLKLIYANTWTAIYNNNYRINSNEVVNEDSIQLEDENINQHYGQLRDDNEIEERLKDNEEAQKQLEKEKQRLKEETHTYNQTNNLSYRYPILTKAIDETYKFSDSYATLIKVEDVQNYVINMIIDGNSEDYITNTFETNQTIKDCAKEITESNESLDLRKGAARYVNRMVREAKEIPKSGSSLWNQLTKDGSDTRKNQTYVANITSIQYEDTEAKKNQKENIKTETTTAKVEEVSKNGNARLKEDINSDENSFVKLFYHSKKAKGNLAIIDKWFFESMEETASIADFEDLMKHLFQIVYNGKSEFTKEEIQSMCDLFDPEKMLNLTETTTTLQLTGGTIEEQVWNYLRSIGFSEESTAGIMGNFYQESGMDPTNDGGAAAGICMFEKATGCFSEYQAYANSKGKEWTDLQSQLEYLMTQLPSAFNTYTGQSPYYYDTGEWCWWPEDMTLDEFKTISDVDKATEIFERVYERASLPMMERRKSAAKDYYSLYHGK